MYAPTIASVIVAKSLDAKCSVTRSAQEDANVIIATVSFLLLSLSLVINVILQDHQYAHRHGNDMAVGEAKQLCVAGPCIRRQNCLNYLGCAAREVVREGMDRGEMRTLEVI